MPNKTHGGQDAEESLMNKQFDIADPVVTTYSVIVLTALSKGVHFDMADIMTFWAFGQLTEDALPMYCRYMYKSVCSHAFQKSKEGNK